MVPEFRQLLEDGDVDRLWQMWGRVAPHLPQPENRDQAEITMHMARTAAESIPERHRLYSHRWLTERMLPSQLPAAMVPPTIVETVGISVNFRSRFMKPAADEVRGAMEHAVQDCYANGDRDVLTVRKQMDEAKDRTLRALFG